MKLLLFTILMMFSLSSFSLEFYRCVDKKGLSHFSNLPESSLDLNCVPKDRYTMMLKQDYLNLSNEFMKYEVDEVEEPELEEMDPPTNSITQSVKDIFDSDKALEELLTSSEKKDNPFKRFFKARSNTVEDILKQGKPAPPIQMKQDI